MARTKRSPDEARAWDDAALPAYLALCLLFGGSSYGGHLPNAFIQLVGIGLLARQGMTPERRRAAGTGRALGAMLLVSVGWSVLTLVPLPAGLWRHAGGRAFLVADYATLGMALPTRPLSLDPDRTIAATLGIVPFVTMLALTLAATDRARRAAAWVAAGIALSAIPLGALQMLGGGASPWYPYAPTNRGDTVGFFANANHLATSFLMTLPFVAALAAHAKTMAGPRAGARGWPFAGMAAFLLLGLVLDGSVAGMLLMVPATAGSALVYLRGTGRPVGARAVGAAMAALAVAAVFLAAGPLRDSLLDHALATGTDPAARATSMRLTAKAVRDFLPLGAGLGSFRGLYPRYEDPGAVTAEFNVHAHDEYLEVALELGLVGIGLIVAALAWTGWRSAAVWSGRDRAGSLSRAASVALAMLLLHSLVDFPARTAAIAALAGFAAALLQAPRVRGVSSERGRSGERARSPLLELVPAPDPGLAPGRRRAGA